MLFHRNPAWSAANPELVAKLERGGLWFNALQAWGIISVAVLLVFRLGMQPAVLFPESLRTPGWEVLMSTSNMLMFLGMVVFVAGAWRNARWLKRNVPLAETRQASLTPRSTDDHLPRWVQYLIYGLMALNIVARPIVDLLYPQHLDNVWGASILTLIMSVLIFLVAAIGVARPPNHLDHAMGPNYRRLEVHVYFGIMVCLALTGLLNVWLELSGIDVRRYGAVITGICVSAALVAFMLLPASDNGQSHKRQIHAA
jgi:hypothetical protein